MFLAKFIIPALVSGKIMTTADWILHFHVAARYIAQTYHGPLMFHGDHISAPAAPGLLRYPNIANDWPVS